ncbi:4-hydroxyphenylpyruvate dioxygenase-like putative hemolysin [Variovorax sp. GrIS 2.14]
MGSADLCKIVDALRGKGVTLVDKRIPEHGESVVELKCRKSLIDGKKDALLLRIFSEDRLGPIFFEFIQRKGDEGFGNGNFKAFFERIELVQMRRGVLRAAQ